MSMAQHTVSRPAGWIAVTPEFGRVKEYDTLQCVHCGGHWVVVPGSGRKRGFCLKCCGPVCGPRCLECRPAEAQLEAVERAASSRTIIV